MSDKPVLRNFLYLDSSAVENYLSGIEGGLAEEETQLERQSKEGGGKADVGLAGLGGIEAGGEGEYTAEKHRQIRATAAARFQALHSTLRENEMIEVVEEFDDNQWDGLRRGDVVEAVGELELSKWDQMAEAIDSVGDLLPVMEQFAPEALNKEAREMLKGVQTVVQLTEEQGVVVSLKLYEERGHPLVARLSPLHLQTRKADLRGDVTLFGRVQRKLKEEQSYSVMQLLPEGSELGKQLEEEMKEASEEDSENPLLERISGPALLIQPIAIWR